MVVESGSDLAAMAPADLFDNLPAAGPVDDATGQEINPDEAPEPEEPAESAIETPADVEPEPATEPAEEPAVDPEPAAEAKPAETATGDELPEGVVRGKDRNGKEGLFVQPDRWKSIYGNHQLMQQTAEMFGEPVTAENIGLRNEAYLAQERLFNDITSGDPTAQKEVVGFFLDEMARAREEGSVSVDAAVPFAQTLYTTLREKSPDAYATLRMSAARDLVGEMFREAAAKKDDALFVSAQHFARAILGFERGADLSQIRSAATRAGLPLYNKDEMAGLATGSDPVSTLRLENERLRSQIEGKGSGDATAQFNRWFSDTKQTVQKSVLDDAVLPALASVQEAWKPFPSEFKDLVVDRLHSKVKATLAADKNFTDSINMLHQQASRANSAQRRTQLADLIRQKYNSRAGLAAEAHKGEVLKFAANWLKQQSDQAHARQSGAQSRTAPKGGTSAPPRSLLPSNLPTFSNGEFDPAVAARQAAALLG